MNFWQFLQQNWNELLTLVGQHLTLVLISTLIAVVIGIPTGILLTRKKALRNPVLGIANVMQTIPSLALFGFLIPLPFIGGIGAVSVFKAVYLDKRELKCACVGGASNVPLGPVSLAENLMMVAMALWMLEDANPGALIHVTPKGPATR